MKNWLTPPVFEDEIKTQQAYLLHVILWTLFCVPIIYLLFMLVKGTGYPSRALIQSVVGETANVILLLMLRRGYVRAASILQVSTFWLFFTVTAVTGNGVGGEAYLLGYSLVIAIAGMLLGATGASVFTFLSLLAGMLMVYGQMNGVLVSSFESSVLTTWVISLLLFPVGAVLQHLGSRIIRSSLDRARTSEARYRLISQLSSNYTFSTAIDTQGNMRLNWVAGALENITGYTFDDYVASGGWLAHLHPEDVEKDRQALEKLKANQRVVHDIRTYNKDRHVRWVRVFAHPVWDLGQNSLIGIVGAVHDIAEQKQTEMALMRERDLLQLLMDNIPDTVYLKDTESRFVRINKTQARFLGLEDSKDAIGKTDFDFQPSELAQQFMQEEKHILETNQPVMNRIEMNQSKAGQPRWLSSTKVPVSDSTGHVIGIIGISRDVTEQKLAEEHEQRRRETLEKIVKLGQYVTQVQDIRSTLQRIWRSVRNELDFDRLSIYLYDAEQSAVDGTYGTNREGEMVEEWFRHVSLGEQTEESAAFLQALRQATALYLTRNYAVENNISPEHTMQGVKDFAAVAAWAGDNPVAVLCVDNLITGRPITDEQLEALKLFAGYAGLAIENARLNAALQKELTQRQTLISELETKNAELERFTYTVSHDLKSPLVTITGFLGFLEKDAMAGETAQVKGTIHRINNAAFRMRDLLNDLLELSRIGRLMNPPENIPFHEIVNEAVDRVHGRLDQLNAIIEIQSDFPTVYGDRVRLIEVIQNLLENAAKYSRPETRPRIEIGARMELETQVTFYVRDNGIGIAPQYHENIFGLFNKLDPRAEGTGIGLTLVRRIVEVHGGKIWVESEAGKGATFYFTLPTTQEKE
jgi:PAS domain S-box-containing protein